LGYSINDRVRFGNLDFDLQVEVLPDKVIGEVISSGKVLKKVEVERSGSEREDGQRVFKALKELLISRLKKRAEEKALYLKEKLSEFFEVGEEQVEGFLMFVPDLGEPLRCRKGEMTPGLERWLLELEKNFLSRYSIKPDVLFVEIQKEGQRVFVFFAQNGEEGIKVVFAVSGVKLSLIRRKLSSASLTGMVSSVLKST